MSQTTPSTDSQTFGLSDSAAKRIVFLLKNEAEGAKLRVSVEGGGCSGFQYKFTFDTNPNDDDIVIEKDGAGVLIDTMSLEFVNGSILDYVDELGASYFAVKNPNATASCGCGNSFAV